MQRGLTLQQLAAQIEGDRGDKRDYIVDTAKIEMQVRGDGEPTLNLPDHGTFTLRPLAHEQIAARTGIPVKYYKEMQKEAPGLLKQNVNTWFGLRPEKRMVRNLRGSTRAFLSNRYQRIENEEIAHAALPVLAELPGVEIPSAQVTDRRLYIHFTVPTIQGEVKRGDVVQAGGIITNSEVGLSRVTVEGLAWRLICLNGMKTGEAFRRNHVGRKIEEDGEMDWADDTRRADDQAVLLKVRDMVRAVVDEARFRATLAKMQGLATEGRISGDPAKAVEVLAQKLQTSEAERGGILRALIEGGDLSRWGVLNAVTAQAHTTEDYDRAVEFEAMGGKLLEFHPKEWKEVLEAA